MGRREARETAMTLLYSFEYHKDNPKLQLDYFLESLNSDDLDVNGERGYSLSLTDKDIEYIEDITLGVLSNLTKIDEYIAKYSRGWAFNRIPKTDVSVLRLSIYEMLFRDDIPNNVSINEAVELAKKYGHDDSGAFVNGILGSVYRELEDQKKEAKDTWPTGIQEDLGMESSLDSQDK